MKDGEIRQNLATDQWVIFAPARGKRPHDFVSKAPERATLAEHDPNCPFCPGNEEHLPPIIEEVPAVGGEGWRTRVIPNKYPALKQDGSPERFVEGIYLSMKGVGWHEVIIESPRHNEQIASMEVSTVRPIIETYHRRYLEILKDKHTMMVVILGA